MSKGESATLVDTVWASYFRDWWPIIIPKGIDCEIEDLNIKSRKLTIVFQNLISEILINTWKRYKKYKCIWDMCIKYSEYTQYRNDIMFFVNQVTIDWNTIPVKVQMILKIKD